MWSLVGHSVVLYLVTIYFATVGTSGRVSLSINSNITNDRMALTTTLAYASTVATLRVRVPLARRVALITGSTALTSSHVASRQVSTTIISRILGVCVCDLSLAPVRKDTKRLFSLQLLVNERPTRCGLVPTIATNSTRNTTITAATSKTATALLTPGLRIIANRVSFNHIPVHDICAEAIDLGGANASPLTVAKFAPSATILDIRPTATAVTPNTVKGFALACTPAIQNILSYHVTVRSSTIGCCHRCVGIETIPFSMGRLRIPGYSKVSSDAMAMALQVGGVRPVITTRYDFAVPRRLICISNSTAVRTHKNSRRVATDVINSALALVTCSLNGRPFANSSNSVVSFGIQLGNHGKSCCLAPQRIMLDGTADRGVASRDCHNCISVRDPHLISSNSLTFDAGTVASRVATSCDIHGDNNIPLAVSHTTFLTRKCDIIAPLPLIIRTCRDSSVAMGCSPTIRNTREAAVRLCAGSPSGHVESMSLSNSICRPGALSLGIIGAPSNATRITITVSGCSSVITVRFSIRASKPITRLPFRDNNHLTDRDIVIGPVRNFRHIVICSLSGATIIKRRNRIVALLFGNSRRAQGDMAVRGVILDTITKTGGISRRSITISVICKGPRVRLLACGVSNSAVFSSSVTYKATLAPLTRPSRHRNCAFDN